MRRGVCGVFVIFAAALIAPSASAQVLRVGTYNGITRPVQLDPGGGQRRPAGRLDPGRPRRLQDERPRARAQAGSDDTPAGVLITTPEHHLRGMNRNRRDRRRDQARISRRAARAQATRTSGQQAGRDGPQRHRGLEGRQRHGPEPHRLQLPAAARATAGNEIWWNGGDGSGQDRRPRHSAAPT